MTPPWLLASSGASLVELKSEAQLRFVGAAIADARRKAFTLYLVVEPELRPLAAILLSGLGAAERPHTGELVKAFPLRGGRTARYIDLTTTQDSDDAVIAKVNELIVLKAFLIVEGAERLPLPNPDFSIELRPPLPGQTRQKYLCALHMKQYTLGTTGLWTSLSPRWWSMHPAYAELRAQKGRKRK